MSDCMFVIVSSTVVRKVFSLLLAVPAAAVLLGPFPGGLPGVVTAVAAVVAAAALVAILSVVVFAAAHIAGVHTVLALRALIPLLAAFTGVESTA